MKQTHYFLSDIYLCENPLLLKFIDLETGESFKKQLTDFIGDTVFLNQLNDNDKKSIKYLLQNHTS